MHAAFDRCVRNLDTRRYSAHAHMYVYWYRLAGVFLREKFFTDLLLCVKLLFTNTVSPVRCGSSTKIQSAKVLFAKYASAIDSRKISPAK